MDAPFPIHPAIVHAPIVMLIVGALFELVGRMLDAVWWRKAATAMLVLGALGAGAAYVTGNQAEEAVEEQGVPEEPIESHEQSGTVTLWLAGAALLARIVQTRTGRASAVVSGVALVLYLGAAVSVGVAAYRGGLLVYEHGAGVKVGGKPVAAGEKAGGEHAEQGEGR